MVVLKILFISHQRFTLTMLTWLSKIIKNILIICYVGVRFKLGIYLYMLFNSIDDNLQSLYSYKI